MKILRYIFILACFIPLFIFRDFTPNNELKYLSIADEAIRNGNILTFWNHGISYADKPPLYFWILMLGKWLTGTHSMLFVALFSMIPALLILFIMDKWVNQHISIQLRNSAQLMLITSGLFVGSAVVLRMDMLMCMFIVLALYTFYKMYTGDFCKANRILLPVYIFLAIFSKGPVGAIVPILSIVIFLLVQRRIRDFGKYLGWKQWTILSGLCAVWFAGVYLEGGKTYLDNLLFNQTVNRAVNAFHHNEPFWYYFKTIWYSLAPWSLFYITTIIIGIKNKVLNTDIEKLFLTIILTTFISLSIFSSKLDIYLLPIFPFIAYLAFMIVPKVNKQFIYFTILIPAMILVLAFPAIFIAAPYLNIQLAKMPLIPIAVFILSASSVISLIYLYRKQLANAANAISIGLLFTILVGSFTIPSFNSVIGYREAAEKMENIAKEKNIQNFYYYQLRSAENIDVYLQKEIRHITLLQLSKIIDKDPFILLIRNKNIHEEKELNNIIQNRKIYHIENYSIILSNPN